MSLSVAVHLISGRSVTLETEANASVESLRQRAQRALSVGRGRLLNSSGRVLDGSRTVEQAGLKSGETLTLHVRQVQVISSKMFGDEENAAFAAILGDGCVVSWGNHLCGGDSSDFRDQLKSVQAIHACEDAFAAVLEDGSLVAWGSGARASMQNVQQVQASARAFAAVLCDGSVVAWGHRAFGGDSRAVQHQLVNVEQLQASRQAFAAILRDARLLLSIFWLPSYIP